MLVIFPFLASHPLPPFPRDRPIVSARCERLTDRAHGIVYKTSTVPKAKSSQVPQEVLTLTPEPSLSGAGRPRPPQPDPRGRGAGFCVDLFNRPLPSFLWCLSARFLPLATHTQEAASETLRNISVCVTMNRAFGVIFICVVAVIVETLMC